jgi:DNA glycosylase AlkZ-like
VALTARQLNRATLARQLLLRREPLSVAEAVQRVVTVQAQEPVSPYIALWNRVAGFDASQLDRAFVDRTVVKAHLMRITMRGIAATDYPAFHQAMQRSLRAARLHDRRFQEAGLSIPEADALVPRLLEFATAPRTGAEIEAWLDDELAERAHPRVWWALRHYAPLHHSPTGGPWSFGVKKAYVRAHEPAGAAVRQAGVRWLVRRYLEGFGPAATRDVGAFAMIYAAPIREAVEALLASGEIVALEGPGRTRLVDIPGGRLPDADCPAPPRLLGMWDEVLLAYRDRSRTIPPAYRQQVARINGDVLPTLLVDGYVAGVWRPLDGAIEATAFETLSDDTWAALESEAQGLRELLHRDPKVYSRYGHWWKDLSGAERRLLGR